MTRMNLLKDMAEAISQQAKGTEPYDTRATVVRTEGNIAWLHIPGGVDETPAEMSINVSPGDTVQVRVANGRAWVTGNNTAPPTDDTAAKSAREAVYQLDGSLDQTEVFNRLTNHSENEGIYLEDGHIYVNASYVKSGYIRADRIQGGTLTLGGQNDGYGSMTVRDSNGDQVGSWNSAGLYTNTGLYLVAENGTTYYPGIYAVWVRTDQTGEPVTVFDSLLEANLDSAAGRFVVDVAPTAKVVTLGENATAVYIPALEGYVETTGGTITGTLTLSSAALVAENGNVYVDDNNLDRTATPSSTQNSKLVSIRDKNNANTAFLQAREDTSGYHYAVLGANAGTNPYVNYLRLGVDGSNNRKVEVADASAWRSAIGAVNKAGDTMTGTLYIRDNSYPTSAPSSNYYGSGLTLRDSANANVGHLRAIRSASDNIGIQIGSNRTVNGTSHENNLYLYSNSNGDPVVAFGGSGQAAWRSALGGSCVPGNFTITTVTITVGTLSANGGTKYNQTTASGINTGTYRILGVVGYELSGNNYTNCSIMKLEMSGANILWSVTNHGSAATGSITMKVNILKVNL